MAPSGAEAKAGELKARFYKDDWQTVLRREPDGSYKYDSVRDAKLLDVKTIAPGTTKGVLTFTPPTVGSYRVTLTDSQTGAASQVEFFFGRLRYSPWPSKTRPASSLYRQEEYASGETATYQVRAPFAAACW